ncbi:MAG: transporter suffix domain-containing protein [Sulfurimonadaceae bacterium]
MSELTGTPESPVARGRLQLGIALFVLSIVLPLAGVPVVVSLGLSAEMIATVSASLLVGAEVLGVAAVAVMGKSGYMYLKNSVFRFLKRVGPPKEVSRRRYTIGLIMFCVPILFSWISPYASIWIPVVTTYPLPFAIGGDFLLLTSLFVLGGNFWDKVRSLFLYDA